MKIGIRAWVAARDGTVAVLMAFTLFIIVGFGAMAVDFSNFYLQRRALQSATDLAAIAAAQNISNATTAALATLAVNGYPAATLQGLTVGTYVADSAVAPTLRFTAGTSSTSNAVQLQTQVQVPLYFANVLQLVSISTAESVTATAATGNQPIGAQGTAAYSPKASIMISSGLVNLQAGVLNAILGGMLGTNLSVSLMNYQSLASANIDLFAFSNALATQAGLTAVTYNQLLSGTFPASQVLAALAAAAQANSAISVATVDVISAIAALAPTTQISLAPLISYGSYGTLNVGSAEPVGVSADALDLISAVAQIANGTHQVQTSLALNLAPIAAANLQLTVGEPPVGTSFVAIGPVGVSVHTAQTRLLLTLQIAQTGSTSLLNLPLYIEIASATAEVTNIACSTTPSATTVTLGVTPGVVNAWIGTVTSAQMSNYSVEPSPAAATLLSIPLVASVTGSAHASITNLAETPVTFSYADIQDLTMKTTSTTDFVSSLLYNLFANLQLNVNVLGLGVGLPSQLDAMIAQTLATATSPIDQTLTEILDALGLGVGQAYTEVTGVKCGNASLVN